MVILPTQLYYVSQLMSSKALWFRHLKQGRYPKERYLPRITLRTRIPAKESRTLMPSNAGSAFGQRKALDPALWP